MTASRLAASRDNRRGQMVLLAGAVVALALVALLVAYLQLGYHADVTGASADDRPVRDAESSLQRVTHDTARGLRGEYAWSERNQAVTDARNSIRPQVDRLQRARVASGVVTTASFNQTAASRWASANCPDGPGREFGPCVADRGVVVQERADRTLVLAVGYDLTVTTDHSETRLATVRPAVER